MRVMNQLKARFSARIAGEYWLGNINLIYPGASLGVIEVDPDVTDPDSDYVPLMRRCIR